MSDINTYADEAAITALTPINGDLVLNKGDNSLYLCTDSAASGIARWKKFTNDSAAIAYNYNLSATEGIDTVPLLHLDASELSLSDGASVTTWADKSGNGYDFTSAGASSPVFKTSGRLGHNTVLFDGTDDYMENGSVLGQFTNQNVTLVAVYNSYVESGGLQLDLFDTGSYGGGDRLSPDYSSAFLSGRINAVTENFRLPSTGNNTFGLRVNSSDPSYEIFYNKKSQYQTNSYSFGVASAMSIGGGNTSYKLNGEISEILLFNENISDSDWNAVHEYLKNKYFSPNINILSGSYALDSTYSVNQSPTFHFSPEVDYLFKSDGGAAASNDDKVMAWLDKASGNVLAAKESGLYPTLKTAHINSQNALYFDGTNLLSGSGVQASFEDWSGDSTLIFAFDANGDSAADPIALPASGSARLINNATSGYMATLRNSRLSAQPHGVNLNAPHITTITTSNTQNFYKIFGNGGSAVTNTTFNNPGWNTKSSFFKVGGASETAYTLNGYIYEILFFDSALSNADMNAVGSYLGSKYGITYSNIS